STAGSSGTSTSAAPSRCSATRPRPGWCGITAAAGEFFRLDGRPTRRQRESLRIRAFPSQGGSMRRVRGSWLLAGLFAVGVAGLASAAGPDNDQIIKYYRKKANVPPSQQVTVANVKDSAIKGAKQGELQIGAAPNTKSVPFTISADGRYVVFGDVEDLTVDPSKAVMQKIKLAGEPSRGPANAKVTIVEFSDFQCPFCSKGYATVEQQVLKDYGDKVKFYYKNYPLP